MTTVRQRGTAQQNTKKTQAKWQPTTSRQGALAQPARHARKKPGSTGRGDYYHIEVQPKEKFVTFRTHDVGTPGHIQRVAGNGQAAPGPRSSG